MAFQVGGSLAGVIHASGSTVVGNGSRSAPSKRHYLKDPLNWPDMSLGRQVSVFARLRNLNPSEIKQEFRKGVLPIYNLLNA